MAPTRSSRCSILLTGRTKHDGLYPTQSGPRQFLPWSRARRRQYRGRGLPTRLGLHCHKARKSPSRRQPARAGWNRSCRMGSDARSLSSVCYRAVNGCIRENPDTGGCQGLYSDSRIGAQSCRTTPSNELWTRSSPLYSMKPSFLNLFMKKLTRDRVVPTISARVS